MGFSPNQGILSGKTTVIITGKHIGFQGPNRYFISFCDDKTCIECRYTFNIIPMTIVSQFCNK